MRTALGIALGILLATEVVGAEKPIPQDTARMEKQRRELLEWNTRTIQGAYDKVGKKDPRWDKPARAALDKAARMFSKQVDPGIELVDINQPARAAVAAGCDDPYVHYLYERTLSGKDDPGQDEVIRRSKRWSRDLAASRYPAFRRAIGMEMAGMYLTSVKGADDATRKEAESDLDAALALLPESVASDELNAFWEEKWFNLCIAAIQVYRWIGMDPVAAYERVDAALAKPPKVQVLRLKVRGNFWLGYGWEARTKAFAPNVPAGGFAALEERLGIAQKALKEAWKLHPDDAQTAARLLGIDKSIRGDRAAMERWFERAMKADGDCYEACFTKLDWLDPKWHGSFEEMLAFGRACRATRNWYAGITLLGPEAHFRHASELNPADRAKYLGTPEVWSEIKEVYTEYLEHYPNKDVARSKYAVLAYMAHHYHEAHAEFQRLGDRLTAWPNFPYFPLAAMKQMRDVTARAVAASPPPGDAAGRGDPAQKVK
jgi:hypothetical protein